MKSQGCYAYLFLIQSTLQAFARHASPEAPPMAVCRSRMAVVLTFAQRAGIAAKDGQKKAQINPAYIIRSTGAPIAAAPVNLLPSCFDHSLPPACLPACLPACATGCPSLTLSLIWFKRCQFPTNHMPAFL